ncbi:MAG TPA: hypothetical protein VF541_10315 [Longimicrobium sp.]
MARFARFAAVALPLTACRNPRAEAVAELTRLKAEMDAHASRYGRYPGTIDAKLPASAANLPHVPPRGIAVYLLSSDSTRYQAVATRQPWSCWMGVERAKGSRVECNPNATSATRPDTAHARQVFDGVMSPAADSAQ